jgi:L-gulonolactone oxidase
MDPDWKIWLDEIFVKFYVNEFLVNIADFFPSILPTLSKTSQKLGFKHKQQVDTSYKIFSFPVLTRHSEMEYSLPVEHAVEAWKEINDVIMSDRHHVNFITEIRFVKGVSDQIYYIYLQRSSSTIHLL